MIYFLKKYNDALIYYDKAIQIDPNYADAYNNNGSALQFKKCNNKQVCDLNKYNEALICYDKVIQIDPNQANVYCNALYKLRKYDDALICYNKAIQIDPKYVDAYYNKGNALYKLNQCYEALLCYNKVIQIDPNQANAYFKKGFILSIDIGNALTQLKQYKQSINNYEEAIKYCKLNEDEFRKLILQIKNMK